MNESIEQKEPFKLPIVAPKNQQFKDIILNKYAALIWRHTTKEKIIPILQNIYELAYSKGLSDMDKMHNSIQNLK